MYKDVLRSMEGVELFPSISLMLLLTFFILLIIYLVRTGKDHWKEVSELPLESDQNINAKISEQ